MKCRVAKVDAPRLSRRENRGAFTLIELLVVIAIIALLISILIPSLRTARKQGQKAVCMSNMRQIGIAVRMYLPDNREWYPSTMEVTSTGFPETISWWAIDNYQTALEQYILQDRGGVDADGRSRGKNSVWFDPADPDLDEVAMWGSFSDNGLITGVPRRDEQIRSPAETVYTTLRHVDWQTIVGIVPPDPLPVTSRDDPFWTSEYFDMCFDPWSDSNDPNDPYHWSTGKATPPCDMFPGEPGCATWDRQIDGRTLDHHRPQPRYGKGQPYAFCDGHVEFMPFEKTYAFPVMNMWDIH